MPLHRFPSSHRLGGKLQFAAVYDAKTKIARFPLLIFTRPNDLPHARLGLSVGRGVGIAVRRNRIKRLLREVFRHRVALPVGYDVVIVVRPHEPMTLAQYQQRVDEALQKSHGLWQRRGENQTEAG